MEDRYFSNAFKCSMQSVASYRARGEETHDDVLLSGLARHKAGRYAATRLRDAISFLGHGLRSDELLVLVSPEHKVHAVVKHRLWHHSFRVVGDAVLIASHVSACS